MATTTPSAHPDESSSVRGPLARFGKGRIYVRFKGGLGNQLFQFAAASSVSGPSAVRVTRVRRTEQLDLASAVSGLVHPWSRWDRLRLGQPFDGATGWRRAIELSFAPVRWRVARRTVGSGPALSDVFEPPSDAHRRPVLFDGYFQHPDWIVPSESWLIDRLIDAAPSEWCTAASAPAVMHVRAGDYVQLGWKLDVSYYRTALGRLGVPSTVRIVTDDPDAGAEVAAMCSAEGWEVIAAKAGATAIDDFWTLAGARRLIMSNSTFCWWAARIGDRHWQSGSASSQPRVVIAPAQWLVGHGRVLLQPSWERV